MRRKQQFREFFQTGAPALTTTTPLPAVTAVAVTVLLFFLTGCGSVDVAGTTTTVETPAGPRVFEFGTVRKTPHFESSTPAAGAVLPAAPINVVIDFNFDLGPGSQISVQKDGEEYGTGDTRVDEGKLAMRRSVNSQAPDGIYLVEYDACWPDGSCHDGRFEFAIQRSLSESLTDMRNRAEVAITMSDISFRPAGIVVSPGTKVTWTNGDSIEHFINTDSHPAHTYFPEQNSRGLSQGKSFSVTFTAPGAYPYHCSAHAAQMTGMIVVE